MRVGQRPCICRYEGLALVNVPHNNGVMVFGSGTGAGIQSVKPFDKFVFTPPSFASHVIDRKTARGSIKVQLCPWCIQAELLQILFRYEGEFFYGFANGLGSYSSSSGETYRGEWSYGKRSGSALLETSSTSVPFPLRAPLSVLGGVKLHHCSFALPITVISLVCSLHL